MKKIIDKTFRAGLFFLIFIFIRTAVSSCESAKTIDYTENAMAVGGPGEGCRHSDTYQNSYHNFSGTLIDHVGEINFSNWIEKISADKEKYINTDCPYGYGNIVRFVKDFNIPRGNFQAILDNSGISEHKQ